MCADFSLDLAPPHPRLRVCVVIPARDEAELLATCLQALANQGDPAGGLLDPGLFEVVVLANNCVDGTARIARGFAARGAGLRVHVVEREFPPAVAHVGTARKYLMDLACARLETLEDPRTLIASTDADSRADRGWVAAQLAALDAGADAVAGLIRVDAAELHSLGPHVRAAYRRDRLYRRLKLELEALIDPNPLDPRPGHDFHGGASLAITPEMYRRVGGLPPLRSLEDVALVEALWLADARLVHCRRARVATSARLVGRADDGHSSDLARWAGGPVAAVPEVAGFAAELVARRELRHLFERRRRAPGGRWTPDRAEVARVARRLEVDAEALGDGIRDWGTFGEWLARVADLRGPRRTAADRPLVPIAAAIEQLRRRIIARRRRCQARAATASAPRGRCDIPPPPSGRSD